MPTKDETEAIKELIRRGYSTQAIQQLAMSGKLVEQARSGAKAGPGLTTGILPSAVSGRPLGANGQPYVLPQSPPPQVNNRGSGVGVVSSNKSMGGTGKSTAGNVIETLFGNTPIGLASSKLGQIISGLGGSKRVAENATRTAATPNKNKQRVAATPNLNYDGGAGFDDVGFTPEEFQAPNFEYRDFTGQAQNQVAGIYDPRYRAIDEAAGRANTQYKRADTITAGLYENLANNIRKIAEGSAARYAQAKQDQTAATAQLVADQGQNYSSSQAQEAALLQQLGQQEAAAQVLGDNSAEQAYQQGQSQRLGNVQNAALTAQGQTQQDYLSNVQDANNTGGVVARQNLIANLGDTLSGYEQDRFNLQGDQAAAALQLAQQLSDRDFSLQQANYGGYRDAYSANNQNAQFAAQLAQQSAQQKWDIFNANRNYGLQTSQAAQQQANYDRQFELDQAKYGTDLATALADQRLRQQELAAKSNQPVEGLSFDNQDPVSRIVGQISNANGGNTQQAQQYYDFVTQATAAIASNGLDAAQLAGNQFAFVEYIAKEAAKRGMDPLLAQAAASSYWSNFYGKRQ